MNHIRTIAEEFFFAPGRAEFVLRTPSLYRDSIIDLRLSISLKPGMLFDGAGCNDVHLYLDGRDITTAYVDELRRAIDRSDQTLLRTEYKRALDQWLAYTDALPALAPPDPATERAIAQSLSDSVPLSSIVARVGDTQQSWSGHLHICNFLYTQIAMEPISLLAVIARYNQAAPAAARLDAASILSFTVSSGRCRLYDEAWSAATDLARGGVLAIFEFVYHNPLIGRIVELEKTVDALRTEIMVRLDELGDSVDQTLNVLTSLDRQVDAARLATAGLTTAVENSSLRLDSLAHQLSALRSIVDRGL